MKTENALPPLELVFLFNSQHVTSAADCGKSHHQSKH